MQAAKGGGATVAAGPRASGRGSACTNYTIMTSACAFRASSTGNYDDRAASSLTRTALSKRPCLCSGPFGRAIEGRCKTGVAISSETVSSTKVCART